MTCIYQRQQIYTSVNHVIIIYAILCLPIGSSRYSTLEKFTPDRQVLLGVTQKHLPVGDLFLRSRTIKMERTYKKA